MRTVVTSDTLLLVDSHHIINAIGLTAYIIWCSFMYQMKESPYVEYTIDLLVQRVPVWVAKRSLGEDVKKATGKSSQEPKKVPTSKSSIRRALLLLEKYSLVEKVGARQRNGRYKRKVRGCLSRKFGKQYVPADSAKMMNALPKTHEIVDEVEQVTNNVSKESEILALLGGDTRPKAAAAAHDLGDALAEDDAIAFGKPHDAIIPTREYPPDTRIFGPDVECVDREPLLEEFGQDTDVIGDPSLYGNPARFVAKRLVHPSVVYETDVPPIMVQSKGINRHYERLIVSEYEHPVFGRYFNHVRDDLIVDIDLPDWGFDDFGYTYPEIPHLTSGMCERDVVILMINAYQAGVEYYTRKNCADYTEGMSIPEKKCVLAAARRLQKLSIKPHLWVVSYLGNLKVAKENAWQPLSDKPPKITRVFLPKTIEKHGDNGNIEMPTPYYETPTASKARMMTRALSEVLWHMRHYEFVTQEDIDKLVRRRVGQLEKMMSTVRDEYKDRYTKHMADVRDGRWIWGRSLE